MGLGKGKTEQSGPRDMTRKDGHWGYTEEAKEWASRARRRDEAEELQRELADAQQEKSPASSLLLKAAQRRRTVGD